MSQKSLTKTAALSLFEFLHMEMVDYVMNDLCKNSKEKAYSVVERMGYNVGLRIAEKLTKDRTTRFADDLDIIKFICKEFWLEVFRKPVDNLKTNHRGTYVLNDNRFLFLTRFATSNPDETNNAAKDYVVYACGVVRGALTVLGIDAFVTAEINTVPVVLFKIQKK
ncbi:hypothetical protein FDP41_005147 [Naegleria fowleri]|uniref:Trafficking protein particle complex subunit 6B n=1 Tax=Naegleria fowleri TaxID=5763 RepID=A0A6A5BPG9_NAEFO|nr:uncharacterized protein FDP41_005147 [Naegleria fowleri]KAF0975820.1 hypothetical protein FDP41_005147 [Naegleria fowleri]CAG4719235.1 unnamed protein product [Naegleria fowleri]